MGMKFVVEKCAILIMKSRKRQMTRVIELQNQEKARNKLQILGINGSGCH